MTTTLDLKAHLDTRLASLTPAQRTIAARHLQGACTLLNLTRNTSQAAWLNAVDEAAKFAAASCEHKWTFGSTPGVAVCLRCGQCGETK